VTPATRARRSEADGPAAISSSIRRAADVLTALTDDPDVGVSELGRRFGWPKSVAHRVLVTLADAGLVAADPQTRRYRLGPAALRLGLAALDRADVHRLAVPHLHALRDRTGETTTLTLLSGETRLYVDQVESSHPVRQAIQIGSHAPLYIGGSSKAMLAFLPPERIAHVLASAAGVVRIDGLPLDVPALRSELARIRAVGYAISQGERIAGATSVAAPIFDGRGEVVGSMSVAGVTIRQDRAALEALGPIVRAEARALSVELGWTPPAEPPPAQRSGDR
jgi:DNA-binding IclR family transcriptional regulator